VLRVLLVEDNRIYRDVFKESLCKHFPTVVIDEAGNGEEALQKMSMTPPHLIFMDIRLPDTNGFELTRKMKKDFPNIRIVILTGYDLPEYRQASVEFGADAFFVKESLNWDEIKALVESID